MTSPIAVTTALTPATPGTYVIAVGATSDTVQQLPVVAWAARKHVLTSAAEEALVDADVVPLVALHDGRVVPARALQGFVTLQQPGRESLKRTEVDDAEAGVEL